jgi:hypothetical protein
MPNLTNTHGGSRANAGRPTVNRKYPLCIRISQEAKDRLEPIHNVSQYIDELICQAITPPKSLPQENVSE